MGYIVKFWFMGGKVIFNKNYRVDFGKNVFIFKPMVNYNFENNLWGNLKQFLSK